MQLQSISNQSFTAAKASKERGSARRSNIDAAIAISDNDLRRAAFYMASIQTDDKKHEKINNVALASLPVVAALRDTLLSRGQAAPLLNGAITSSPAARVLTGTKTFAKWTGALAVASGVVAVAHKLTEKSSKVRQFVNDNPYTAMATAFVTTVAAFSGLSRLAPVVNNKILGKDPMKTWRRVGEAVVKFNDNKVVKNVAKTYTNVVDKLHPALKSVGRVGLAFAPLVISTAAIVHTFNHRNVRNNQAIENYTNMKVAQAVLKNQRARELQGLKEQS